MKLIYTIALCPLIALSGCAGLGADYIPILDGPPGQSYQSDLNACQSLARNQQQIRQETTGATIAGAVVGGVIAEYGGGATAIEGIVIGALTGFFGGTFEAADQRKSIVVECMKGRGNRVVG